MVHACIKKTLPSSSLLPQMRTGLLDVSKHACHPRITTCSCRRVCRLPPIPSATHPNRHTSAPPRSVVCVLLRSLHRWVDPLPKETPETCGSSYPISCRPPSYYTLLAYYCLAVHQAAHMHRNRFTMTNDQQRPCFPHMCHAGGCGTNTKLLMLVGVHQEQKHGKSQARPQLVTAECPSSVSVQLVSWEG